MRLIRCPNPLVLQNHCRSIDSVPCALFYPICHNTPFILQTTNQLSAIFICQRILKFVEIFHISNWKYYIPVSVNWMCSVDESSSERSQKSVVNSTCHTFSKASVVSMHFKDTAIDN